MMAQHKQPMPVNAQAVQGLAEFPAGRPGESARNAVQSELFARLTAAGRILRLQSGFQLVGEGAIAESALVLLEGVVMKFKNLPGDRRQIAGFAYAPALLLPFRFDAPWPYGLWTIGPVACCHVGERPFHRVLQQDRRFYPLLLELVQDELRDQQELLVTLACLTPLEKIAGFLLRTAERRPMDAVKEGTVALPMTRVQIADHLGLAPETVSRTFARLAADGLVSLPRPSRVVLHDRDALRALAEGRALS